MMEVDMEVSPVRDVKRTRKRYRCDWCWEHIEKGEQCKTWFTYGENVSARMHPECFDAAQKADIYDEELPPPGTYRRGCWCGENKEHCRCTHDNNV
jgi:hypothetical protein